MDTEMLDADLILEDDPIRIFLQKQLETVRHANSKLEKQIEDKEKLLEECLNMTADMSSDPLRIVGSWKRIHNNKCVIGIRLKNSGIDPITVESIILNWNSPAHITYKTKILEINPDGILKTLATNVEEIKNDAILLLVMEKPEFSKQIAYTIDGIILYTSEKLGPGNQVQIGLGDLRIAVNDFSDRSLRVNLDDVPENFLTCLVSQEGFELVAKLAHHRNITEDLSIRCGYREIATKSSTNRLFLLDNFTSDINGSLIEIAENTDDNIFEIKIICANEQILFQILHHIYDTIEGLCVLPKSHELSLHRLNISRDTEKDEINKEKFAEALEKQLRFIRNFYKGKVKMCGSGNYFDFRSRLNQLQLETDLLYLKCCSNNA